MSNFKWTDENRETVRAMWSKGANMREIAAIVGYSRSAIAGLIKRMGLRKMPKPRGQSIGNPAPIQRARPRPNMQTINARAARMQVSGPPALPVDRFRGKEHIAPKATRKKLLKLAEADCRFPCDTSPDGSLWFCGAPQNGESSYCQTHAKIAFSQAR